METKKKRSENRKRFLKGSIAVAVFSFVLSGLLYVSCNKEDSLMYDSSLPGYSKNLSTERVSPGNPANPLDSVGIYHNEILAQARAIQKSGSRQDPQTIVVNCFRARFPSRSQDAVSPISQEDIQEIIADTAAFFYNFIAGTDLSLQSKTSLNSLISQLIDIPDPTYKKLKSKIIEYENTIISQRRNDSPNTSFWASNNQESDRLLSATSTLRHSLLYWENESGGNPSGELAAPGFWRRFLRIALCDALGALEGYVYGGTSGAIIGGIGSSIAAM